MSKVILCADDSVTMQTVAEITFRATEFGYAGARSADEAVDKVKAQRPVLVLADAVMPGKTGYDLCHALKSDPATADIPVVILCGNSAPYDGAKGAQVGADGSLTKPWDTQVMLDKVAEILDKVAATGVARAAGKAAAAPASTPAIPAPTPIPVAPPPVVAAAQPKVAPPRSATIMGMPTIKMPGPAPVAHTPAPVAVAPAPRPGSATGPVAQAPVAHAPVAHTPVAAPATMRGVAPIAVPVAQFSTSRAPMVAGSPTKRSILVEHTLAKMGERLAELSGLAPGSPELAALVKLSSEIVERVVWEVVPDLAETIIREHVADLATKRAN
ncbi:MAG: response regulator [Myxococcales bacterium]|nr:response regulator [Myxococcales bacterium]